jgi:hypothetical protein
MFASLEMLCPTTHYYRPSSTYCDKPLYKNYRFVSPMARFAFATKPSLPQAFNLFSQ